MCNRYARTFRTTLLFCFLLPVGSPHRILPASAADEQPPLPVPIAASNIFVDAVEAHLGYVTEHAVDEYGRKHTPKWLAHIDIRTSRLPEPPPDSAANDSTSENDQATSNLYLDQPTMVAAIELGRRTGCKCYSDAVEGYLQSDLQLMREEDDPRFPVGRTDEYHVVLDRRQSTSTDRLVTRLHTPAWEIMWREAPKETEYTIRANAKQWLESDSSSQEQANTTSRLADRAIVLDSLAWLVANKQEPDATLLAMSRKLAAKPAAPDASLGAVGSWIESLVRASRNTGNPRFIQVAATTWNQRAAAQRDTMADSFFDAALVDDVPSLGGQSNGRDRQHHGNPQRLVEVRSSAESPLPWAEASLSLWQATRHARYRNEAIRWANALRDRLAANRFRAETAEDYARSIHFLLRAAQVFNREDHREAADKIARLAMTDLYEPTMGMFRSRLGIDRCDAKDGPGFLLLALLALDGPDPTDQSALHF